MGTGGSYVVAGEVVHLRLGQHAVVCGDVSPLSPKCDWAVERTLKLRLPERRRVASDDDELGLAGAQSLQGGLVAERDLAGLERLLDGIPCCIMLLRGRTLIVSASLALMDSAALWFFLGAIASVGRATVEYALVEDCRDAEFWWKSNFETAKIEMRGCLRRQETSVSPLAPPKTAASARERVNAGHIRHTI